MATVDLNPALPSDVEAVDDALTAHKAATNPHGVDAADVGLGSVDNTADADKPVSTAMQTALEGKSDTGHNHAGVYDVIGAAAAAEASATSSAAANLAAHAGVTTAAHGGIVASDDARLTDERTPVDGSVTTAKLDDAAVTAAKLATMSKAELLVVLANVLDVPTGLVTTDADGEIEGELIQLTDTDANLQGVVPAAGQIAHASDTLRTAMGDGATAWEDLPEIAPTWATITEAGTFEFAMEVTPPLSLADANLIIKNDGHIIDVEGDGVSIGGGTVAPGAAGIAAGQFCECNTQGNSPGMAVGNSCKNDPGGYPSFAFGYFANALNGTFAFASAFGAGDNIDGQHQVFASTMGMLTVDATPGALALGIYTGLAIDINELVIPADTAWDVTASIVAIEEGASNAKRFKRSCLIANFGGTINISAVDTIGTDQTLGTPGAWAVALGAAANGLEVTVTGEAATNIRWTASIIATQVVDGSGA